MKDERMMDSTKIIYHMDKVRAFYDEEKKIAPILINLGATKKCNANCVYCFGNFQGKDQVSSIAREPLLKLFYDAPHLGVKAMEIIGDGEPTLNPHIYDAMDIGKREGLDMAFSTNGIKLNVIKMNNILKNNKWMRFNISTGTNEGYKKIHRVDKFYVVKNHISEMVKIKKSQNYECDIGLQSVFVPWLMNEDVISLSKMALDLEVDYLVIKQCSLPDKNQGISDVWFDVNDYDKSEIVDILKTCENMSNDKTKIIVKWNFMDIGKRRPYDRCVDVPLLFQVSGNGKCYPCGYLFMDERYEYGDLNKQSLEEILNSDRYWTIVKYMIEKFDVHKDCGGCCRHDKINEFIWKYLQKPKSINFI